MSSFVYDTREPGIVNEIIIKVEDETEPLIQTQETSSINTFYFSESSFCPLQESPDQEMRAEVSGFGEEDDAMAEILKFKDFGILGAVDDAAHKITTEINSKLSYFLDGIVNILTGVENLIRPEGHTCHMCWRDLFFNLIHGTSFFAIYEKMKDHHDSIYVYRYPGVHNKMPIVQGLAIAAVWQYVMGQPLQKAIINDASLVHHIYERFYPNKETMRAEIGGARNMFDIFRVAFPFFSVSQREFKASAEYARGLNSCVLAAEKFFGFVIRLVDYISTRLSYCLDVDVDYAKWKKEVDQIDVIYSVEGVYTSQKKKLSRFASERDALYRLYRIGVALEQKYEMLAANATEFKQIQKRVQTIKQIIITNIGSYVGTEGKLCPFVLYVHGNPKVGKTVLVDHLFRDIYAVLGDVPYNPSLDKYSYNPLTPYFDTYTFQRVFEVQDFMQLLAKDNAMTEVVNLMKMADESAYHLNVAECTAKGTVYFCSEFIYITSNVDIYQSTSKLSSIITSPEAFYRRIDVNVQLQRDDVDVFSKDAYKFVMKTSDGECTLNYNEFVAHVAHAYLNKKQRSMEVMDIEKTFDVDRIEQIRQLVPHLQNLNLRNSLVRCVFCYKTNYGKMCKHQQYTSDHENCFFYRDTYCDKKRFEEMVVPTICCGTEKCTYCEKIQFQHLGKLQGVWRASPRHDCLTKNGTQHVCSDRCMGPPIFKNTIAAEGEETGGSSSTSHSVDEQDKVLCSMYNIVPDNPQDKYDKQFYYRAATQTDHKIAIPLALYTRAADKYEGRIIRFFPGGWARPFETGDMIKQKDQMFYHFLCDEKMEGLTDVEMPAYFKSLSEATKVTILYVNKGHYESFGAYEEICRIHKVGHGYHYLCSFDRLTVRENYYVVLTKFRDIMARFSRVSFSSVKEYVWSYISPTERLKYDAKMMLSKFLGWVKNALVVFGLAVAGLTLYLRMYSVAAQGIGNTSGGYKNTLGKTSRIHKIAGPKGYRMRGESSDIQYRDLVTTLRPAIGRINTSVGTMQCLALQDHIIAFPYHAIVNEKDLITVQFPHYEWDIFFRLSDLSRCWLSEENHCILADLSSLPTMKNVRSFPRITKKIVSEKDLDVIGDGKMLVCADRTQLDHKSVTNVSTYEAEMEIKTSTHSFKANDLLRYTAATIQGDCGAPIICTVKGIHRVIGFHTGSHSYSAFGCVLTKEWIDSILNPEETKIVEAEIFPTSDEIVPIEIVARLNKPLVFMPRKSKLVHSPFFKKGDVLKTAPAALKGKFGDFTPLEKAFGKSLVPMVVPSPNRFSDGLDYVNEFYGCSYDRFGKLTVDQAVFGIEGNEYLCKIDSSAGVGYPWNLNFSRKDLYDWETRFLHPDIRSSIDLMEQIISSGKQIDIVVIDTLKDERLPIPKVLEGKTRMFSILGLDVNILLKMYFGHFSAHVMSSHVGSPVKVGMSIKRKDIDFLANYIRLDSEGVHFLCGDLSASDRVIPFEVFMEIVKIVNNFYDDDLSPSRYLLAKAVFQPVHSCDTLQYRTSQGMPSGSYLTALFNSLAYAVMMSQMYFDQVHSFYGWTIATFGDDHIMTFPTDVILDPVKWFKQFGMVYTNADKTDLVQCVDKEEVTFLKRKFARVGLVRVFRLQLEDIHEMAKWYHLNSVTKSWSEHKLVVEILANVCYEMCLYGEEVFVSEFTQYHELFRRLVIKKPKWQHYFDMYLDVVKQPECQKAYKEQFIESNYKIPINAEADEELDMSGQTRIGGGSLDVEHEDIVRIEDFTGDPPETVFEEYLPPLDVPFEWPRDYCKQLEREFVLYSHTLDPVVRNIPFLRIVPLWFLLDKPYIKERINKAVYIRTSVKFTIKIVATKFHYGAIMAVFRPLFYNTQTYLQPAYKRNGIGPWDHVISASQCEHRILSITSTKSVSIILPWTLPVQYLPINLHSGSIFDHSTNVVDFFTVDLYLLTDILPTNIEMDPPEFIVMASLMNVHLYGFSQKVQTFTYPTPFPPLPLPLDTVGIDLAYMHSDRPQGTQNRGKNVGSIVAQVAETNEVRIMDGPISSYVSPFVSIASSVVGYATKFVNFLASLGLSHPLDDRIPKVVANNYLSSASTVGKSNCIYAGFNPAGRLEPIPRKEDKVHAFATLAEKFTYLTFVKLKDRKDSVTLRLNPFKGQLHEVSKSVWLPVAGYLMSSFRYYRCGLQVKLLFFSSAFLNAKVRISIEFSREADNYENSFEIYNPSIILDVNGDVEKIVTVPYMYKSAFIDRHEEWDQNFQLHIELLTDVVSTEKIEASPVMMAVFAAFPGLQFHTVTSYSAGDGIWEPYIPVPKANASTGVVRSDQRPYHERPLGWFAAEGKDLFPRTSFKVDSNYSDTAQGDIPLTVYHVIKRPSKLYYTDPDKDHLAIKPLAFYPAGNISHMQTLLNPAPHVNPDMLMYFLAMFKYWRGSVDIYRVFKVGNIVLNYSYPPALFKGRELWDAHLPATSIGDGIDEYSNAPWLSNLTTAANLPYRSPLPYEVISMPLHITVPATNSDTSDSDTQKMYWPNGIFSSTQTVGLHSAEQFSKAAGDDFEVFCFVGCPAIKLVRHGTVVVYKKAANSSTSNGS